jgi:hypothetical protein
MTYYIWFDESDKEGEFYSNFYGGILIKSFLILPPFYCVNLIFLIFRVLYYPLFRIMSK